MTSKQKRRMARWIMRYVPSRVLRDGRFTKWLFWELQMRMHERGPLPPEE